MRSLRGWVCLRRALRLPSRAHSQRRLWNVRGTEVRRSSVSLLRSSHRRHFERRDPKEKQSCAHVRSRNRRGRTCLPRGTSKSRVRRGHRSIASRRWRQSWKNHRSSGRFRAHRSRVPSHRELSNRVRRNPPRNFRSRHDNHRAMSLVSERAIVAQERERPHFG